MDDGDGAASEQGRFEELPERRRSPRARAALVAAGTLVGLAVVAGIVVGVVSSTAPSAKPGPTVTVPQSTTPSPTPTTSAPRFLISAPPNLSYLARLTPGELAAAHERCPRLAPTCTTTGETPIAVSNAIRQALPGASDFVAVSDIAYSQISGTTTSGPMLAYRRLSAHNGTVRVTVEVRQVEEQDGGGSISFLRGGIATVREQQIVGTHVVEVQASAAHPDALDGARLRRLAADDRLLATG